MALIVNIYNRKYSASEPPPLIQQNHAVIIISHDGSRWRPATIMQNEPTTILIRLKQQRISLAAKSILLASILLFRLSEKVYKSVL